MMGWPSWDGSLQGRIKSFNSEKGFGFIECPYTFAQYNRDVFLHKSQIGDLNVGQMVSFKCDVNKQGMPQATNVVATSGIPAVPMSPGSKGQGKGRGKEGKAGAKGKGKEGKDGKGDTPEASTEVKPEAKSEKPGSKAEGKSGSKSEGKAEGKGERGATVVLLPVRLQERERRR